MVISKSLKIPETAVLDYCVKQEKRNIEFLCKTHKTGSCSACFVTKHNNCEGFYILSVATDMFTDEIISKHVEEIKEILSKIETTILEEN